MESLHDYREGPAILLSFVMSCALIPTKYVGKLLIFCVTYPAGGSFFQKKDCLE
jgi:hypothetical protein